MAARWMHVCACFCFVWVCLFACWMTRSKQDGKRLSTLHCCSFFPFSLSFFVTVQQPLGRCTVHSLYSVKWRHCSSRSRYRIFVWHFCMFVQRSVHGKLHRCPVVGSSILMAVYCAPFPT